MNILEELHKISSPWATLHSQNANEIMLKRKKVSQPYSTHT